MKTAPLPNAKLELDHQLVLTRARRMISTESFTSRSTTSSSTTGSFFAPEPKERKRPTFALPTPTACRLQPLLPLTPEALGQLPEDSSLSRISTWLNSSSTTNASQPLRKFTSPPPSPRKTPSSPLPPAPHSPGRSSTSSDSSNDSSHFSYASLLKYTR